MISKGWLGIAALLGALASGAWLWSKPRSGSSGTASSVSVASASPASAPIEVEVQRISTEPLEVQVTATGTLLGREAVQIVSELSRRLVRVRAEEGSVVRQGDVLFELDASDLQAELAKLDVQARLAQATLARTERLSAEGLSNQQELDLARARVDQATADRQALRVTLGKTLIRAPFAGRLGLRRVSEGAWVSPSTLLSTLQDTSSMKLDFTLPERYAGAVRQGGEFRFRVEGRSETFMGKVAAIEPSVDPATRSLLVRGVIEGETSLVPGAAASVEVPLRVERALLVPALAIVPGIEGRRVFVAAGGRARSTPVEVGFRSGDRAQVVSGLREGDAVITTNLLRLREDMPVQVASAEAVR
jgi:membrane fusion protein (multidrug efflux system)